MLALTVACHLAYTQKKGALIRTEQERYSHTHNMRAITYTLIELQRYLKFKFNYYCCLHKIQMFFFFSRCLSTVVAVRYIYMNI